MLMLLNAYRCPVPSGWGETGGIVAEDCSR
jgi:hypothetical protein